ncbi:membrane dipeptidase, partial [Kineococcus sp. T13]|uniref:hypothetical protein n=1 Tax=Kineococcus vitellinus TaxID=2696565 RepID=UPI00196AFB81
MAGAGTASQAALEAAHGRAEALRRLLAQVRAATGGVPGLQRPAAAVGAAGSWTGRAAERLHAAELAPLA